MRRTDVTTAKESNANVYSNSVIYFGMVFIMLIIIYEDIFCDQHREFIHDQPCKDFLYYAVLLFRMESNKANVVLQFSKRGFDTPEQFVDVFYILSREFIIPEIGNKSFVLPSDIFILIILNLIG